MNGLLRSLFGEGPRRNQPSNRIRTKALPKRQDFFLELLKASTPVRGFCRWHSRSAGKPDRRRIGHSAKSVEPAVSINNTDPGNVIVSAHSQLQASFNEGLSFTSTATFPNVPTQNPKSRRHRYGFQFARPAILGQPSAF